MNTDEMTSRVRERLDRARDHLERLDSEQRAWIDSDPYTIVMDNHANPAEWIYRLDIRTPIPPSWSILFAEMVNCLASALDQAVYVLACDELGQEPRTKTSFPAYRDIDAFNANGVGPGKIKPLGSEARKFIESLQPHQGRKTAFNRLVDLHDYWNEGKHRQDRPWGLQVDILKPKVLQFDPAPLAIYLDHKVLHHGDEIFRISYAADPGQVNKKGQLPLQVAVGDPADPEATESESIHTVYDYAAGICHLLLSMRGRQDIPLL